MARDSPPVGPGCVVMPDNNHWYGEEGDRLEASRVRPSAATWDKTSAENMHAVKIPAFIVMASF